MSILIEITSCVGGFLSRISECGIIITMITPDSPVSDASQTNLPLGCDEGVNDTITRKMIKCIITITLFLRGSDCGKRCLGV